MTLDPDEYERAEDDKAWDDDLEGLRAMWPIARTVADFIAWDKSINAAEHKKINDDLDAHDDWRDRHDSTYQPSWKRRTA